MSPAYICDFPVNEVKKFQSKPVDDVIPYHNILKEIPNKIKKKILYILEQCSAKPCVYFDFISNPLKQQYDIKNNLIIRSKRHQLGINLSFSSFYISCDQLLELISQLKQLHVLACRLTHANLLVHQNKATGTFFGVNNQMQIPKADFKKQFQDFQMQISEYAKIPSEVFRGDWVCKSCQNQNYNQREQCKSCSKIFDTKDQFII